MVVVTMVAECKDKTGRLVAWRMAVGPGRYGMDGRTVANHYGFAPGGLLIGPPPVDAGGLLIGPPTVADGGLLVGTPTAAGGGGVPGR